MVNTTTKQLSIPRSYILNDKLEDNLLIFVLKLKSEFENGNFSIYDIPTLHKKLGYNQDICLNLLNKSFRYNFLAEINTDIDFSSLNDFRLLMKDYTQLFLEAHNIKKYSDLSEVSSFLLECDSVLNNFNYREYLRKAFNVVSLILKRYTRADLYINTFIKLSNSSISIESQKTQLDTILSTTSNIIIYLKSDIVLRRKLSFSESHLKNQFNIIMSTYDNINIEKSGNNRLNNNNRKLIKNIRRYNLFCIQNKELLKKVNNYNNLKLFFNNEKSLNIKINSFRPKLEQLKDKIPVSLKDKENLSLSISQFEWLQLKDYNTVKNLFIKPEINYKVDLDFIKNNTFHTIKRKLVELRILYLVEHESKGISYTELSNCCRLSRSKIVELVNEMVKSKKIFKNHFESILMGSCSDKSTPINNLCFIHNGNVYMKPKNEYDVLEKPAHSWQTSKKINIKYSTNKRLINISAENPFKELINKLQKFHDKNIDRIEHFKIRTNNRTAYIYVNFKGTHFEIYKSTKNTYYRNLINGTHVEDYMLYKFLGKNSNVIMYSTLDYESVKFDTSHENFISKIFNKRSDSYFFGEKKFELLYNQR